LKINENHDFACRGLSLSDAMGHKNRGEDAHNGASRNSRRGSHRRYGSWCGCHYQRGNSATPCFVWCYPAVAKRMLAKRVTSQELKQLL
jgi:hypothetical protein